MIQKVSPIPIDEIIRILDGGNFKVGDGRRFVGDFGFESYFVILPRGKDATIAIYVHNDKFWFSKLMLLLSEFRFNEIIYPYWGYIDTLNNGISESLYYCRRIDAKKIFMKLKSLYKE